MRPDYYKVTVKAMVPGTGRRDVTLECFDLIDALGADFYLGNAIKYLFRVGRKNADRGRDLAKAITFLQQMKERDEQADA